MGTRFEMVITETDTPTRDQRGERYVGLPWTASKLPAPVYYQPLNKGHEDGELVGEINTVSEVDGDLIGRGEFYDDPTEPGMERIVPIAREAIAMSRRGAVAPSFDAGEIAAENVGDPDEEPVLTSMDLWGATLVGIPAFTGTGVTILDDEVPAEDVALVAATNSGPEDSYPIAPRDHAWDGAAAAERVAAHCGVDEAEGEDGEPWACYGNAFLYRDNDADPATKAAYKLGVIDVIDGEFMVVPEAVIAVAAVLQGARGGADIPETEQAALRGIVATLYERINEATGSDLAPPWEDDEAPDDIPADMPGESDAAAARLALVAAVTEPVPAEAFCAPSVPSYTPGFTIEGRRIWGHITNRNACHMGWGDVCMTPPPSASGYKVAQRYSVRTSAGEKEVARFTSGLGKSGPGCPGCRYCRDVDMDDHACISLGFTAAVSHHDTMTTLADIAIGEDDAGNVWAAGILRTGLPAEADDILARRVWSGDWRPHGAGEELAEVLALHHAPPGFTRRVQHSRSRFALVAAAGPAQAAPVGEDERVRAAVAAYHRDAAELERLTAAVALAEIAAA